MSKAIKIELYDYPDKLLKIADAIDKLNNGNGWHAELIREQVAKAVKECGLK